MWVLFAFGSAFFAGLTSITAKCGIKETDSHVATAIRTFVVLLMAALMVTIVGSWGGIVSIPVKSWVYLVLSGIATGASWLCYYKALSCGDVNKVVPIDKSSTVLTAVLAMIIFGEKVTVLKVVCLVAIAAGTFLMIEKKKTDEKNQTHPVWLVCALLSAVFAALTSILAKVGITDVESNLGTFIRTGVVLIVSWLVVFICGKGKEIKNTPKKELIFILVSGAFTGASWLCYFYALQQGDASVVVPIDKLSILVSIAFSYIVFKEKLSVKAIIGLILIVAGTLCMLI